MGDQIAEISYGVMIKENDFKKLSDILFAKVKGKEPYCWISTVEIDKNSVLTIDQPYETEDYLLIVRESTESAFNGTKALEDFASYDYASWNEALNNFITQHNIHPETKIGWMLTAHYG